MDATFSGQLNYTADPGFTGTDPLTVSAYGSNASGSSTTTTSTLLLDVLPQVAPTTINAPYSINAGLGGVAIFNGTGNNSISISDPSAGTGTIQVSLQLGSGTLTLGSTTGVTIDSGANDSDSITFTGTVAAVNNALDGLQYTSPDDSEVNSDVLTINVSDLGHNSFDQPEVAQQQVLVNNPYFIQPRSLQYVAPGASVVFNSANGNALAALPHGSDQEELEIDDESGTLTLASTTGLTFTAGGNGQTSMTILGSASAINNALNGLTYTAAADALSNGANASYDWISFTLSDPSLPGSDWYPGNLSNGYVSVAINPTGTAPASSLPVTITTPPAQSTGVGAPLTFSAAGGNAIVVNDPGAVANGDNVSLSISANYGTLALTQTSGVSVYTQNNGSTLTLSGTVSEIDTALDTLVYTPNSGFAGVDTLQFTFKDSTGQAFPTFYTAYASQSLGIVVGASSQGVPVSAPTTSQSASPTAPLVFSPGNGNAITLSNPGISATTPVQITLSVGGTGTLNLGGTSGVNIVSGANGSSSLTISGTIDSLNAALDGLTYTPGSGDVGRTELDLTVSVPGDSALGTTAARVPLLDELSAPPAVINVPSGQLFNTVTPIVFSTGNQNAISLNDPGMGNQQVELTLSVQDGTLTLGSVMGLTFNSGANGQATMTISGTVAAINQALNGLTYTSSGSVSSDTLSISLSDIGGSGPRTTVASVGLQALMWNQGQSFESSGLQNTIAAPVVTLPSGPLPITGTPAPISGVSVGGAALVNVTLSVQNGVLQVPTTAGVTIEHDGTSSIELIGSATAVNAALARLTYTGNAGFTGSDSLSVSANAVAELSPPQDLFGHGPYPIGYPYYPIYYPPYPIFQPIINPWPIYEPIFGPWFNEPVTLFNANATQPATNDSTAGLPTNVATTNVATTTSLTATPSTASTSDSLAFGVDGLPYWGWGYGYPIQVTQTFSTQTSVTTTATLALNVSPPSLNVPTSQKMTNAAPLVFSTAEGNAISITDPGVGTNPVQVSLSVSNGTLTLANTAGLTFGTGTGSGNTTMTFTGTMTAVANALNGLSYSTNSGFTGTDTLDVSFSDLGNGGAASPITLNNSVAIRVTTAQAPAITLSLPTGPIAVNTNPWFWTEIPGVSVSEQGSGPIQVTLSVQNGTLSVPTLFGVTVTGNNTSSLTLTGSAAAIDANLEPYSGPEYPNFYPDFYPYSPIRLLSAFVISTGLEYTPNAGYFGTDTLSVTAKDAKLDNGSLQSGTVTLNIPTPGAPVVTPSGNQASFTVGGSPVAVDSGICVTSSDTNLAGATVTISPGTLQPGDTLSIPNNFSGITGSYANGVLTLTGAASPGTYQAALRSIVFSTTSSSNTTRSISIVVDDGPLVSNTASEQVSITGGTAGIAPTFKPAPPSGPGGTHGTHPVGPLNSTSGMHGGHTPGDPAGSGGGSSTGGFNYVPPSQAPVTSGGGTSTKGTSNQNSGKKSFAPVDSFFSAFDPSDLD